jgi:hypothetical protein
MDVLIGFFCGGSYWGIRVFGKKIAKYDLGSQSMEYSVDVNGINYINMYTVHVVNVSL